MALRAVRLAALILLAIGSVEILQAERLASLPEIVADCESIADGGAAPAWDDTCDGCVRCEALVSRARLTTPLTAVRGPATFVRRPRPGVCSAPYHPPR